MSEPSSPRARDRKSSSALSRALRFEIERTSRPGEADDAMAALERAMEADEAGDHGEARRLAIRAKQSAPRSATVRRLLGRAAFAMGEWHEAAQELLTYRRFSGDHRDDPLIADAYRRQGKHGQALDVVDALDRAAGENTWLEGQVVRARVLADEGRPGDALALLRRVKPGPKASKAARARVAAMIRSLEP